MSAFATLKEIQDTRDALEKRYGRLGYEIGNVLVDGHIYRDASGAGLPRLLANSIDALFQEVRNELTDLLAAQTMARQIGIPEQRPEVDQ